MKYTLRLLANDEQTRFKYKHDSCCIGNESVPIQLAQCWFSGLAFLTLKYKYIHRRNFVCGDGDLSPPLLKVVVTVTTTFESGGDCHHHLFKVEFATFQTILSFTISQFYAQPIFPCTLGKRIVFFLLPEASCGLKYAENPITAWAAPRTPLGELTTLPQTP